MNIKVGEKKVNSFSVGNPASGLGDAIVGTYGLGGSGRCEHQDPGNETITTELPWKEYFDRYVKGVVFDYILNPDNPYEPRIGGW